MTNGRINYAPDYKSEKRKPLNPRVKISPGGRPYVETKDLVDSVLRRIRGTSDPDRETERARLRDVVIGTALRLRRSALALQKFWSGQDEGAPHAAMEIDELADEFVRAREAFDAAADALIEFESQEK